jgi:hypothetical protein
MQGVGRFKKALAARLEVSRLAKIRILPNFEGITSV